MTFYQTLRVLATHVVADTIIISIDETGNEFHRIEFVSNAVDTAGILIPQAVADSIVFEEEIHQLFTSLGFKPLPATEGVYVNPSWLEMKCGDRIHQINL